MILKHLVKLLQDLDPNSEIRDFEIKIDDVCLTIKDVPKNYDGRETKIFKRKIEPQE
jgi:hypothetical protein